MGWPVHDNVKPFRPGDKGNPASILGADIKRRAFGQDAARHRAPFVGGVSREKDVVVAKVDPVRPCRQRPDPGRQTGLARWRQRQRRQRQRLRRDRPQQPLPQRLWIAVEQADPAKGRVHPARHLYPHHATALRGNARGLGGLMEPHPRTHRSIL